MEAVPGPRAWECGRPPSGLALCASISAARLVTEPAAPEPRIVIVRHAETSWSLDGRHTGRTDLPLTESGLHAAELVRGALAHETFEAVFTSPLQRAAETCRLAGLGDHAEVRPELREWDYGDYEGITTAEIRASVPGWSLWTDGAPGGESPEEVQTRVDRFIEDLRSIDGQVALFSHGHLSRALAVRWIDLPIVAGQSLLLATGAISVLGVDRGTPVIERWNDDHSLHHTR